ncbi:MAG: carboxyl-terminal processing protease [Frankiales bacterium]|jgi:carboxyl-terminal processing protease|nr:carboxyl-terminal processing protease [Frankiales bacterium]
MLVSMLLSVRRRRRVVRGLAAAAVAVLLFGAGVLADRLRPHQQARAGATPTPAPAASLSASALSASGHLDAVRDRIAASAVGTVDKSALDQAAVQGMLGALHDKWANYLTAAQYAGFEQTLDGRFSGVGIWLHQSGSTLSVSSVQPSSPASEAGVRKGDTVVSINGKSTKTMSVAAAAAALRGVAGSKVSVVVRSGTAARTLNLVRRALPSDDVTVDKLSARVGRITIGAFTRGVGRQVRDALSTLRAEHVTGVVLDLRDNPGGLLDEAVEAASALLPAGTAVVSYAGKSGKQTVLKASGDNPDTVTPVAVLVDGATASAAEILAGALQDDKRAVIVGSRTFGKGTVQQPMPLPDGSAIELTIAQYRTPSGRSLDGIGLDPDIDVAVSAGAKAAESRATEVLSGLLADAGTGGHG